MTKKQNRLWSREYILLGSSLTLLSLAFYFLLPTLPIYAVDVLQVTNSQLGLVVAIYTLAALIVRPFAGIAIDLYGRKWILIISTGLFTLLFLGYAWSLAFVSLMLVRFFHGLQWGIATSAYFTAAVDVIPVKKRGRGIGYFGLAFNMAMAVGPAIALLIMGEDRYALLFYAAALLALLGR